MKPRILVIDNSVDVTGALKAITHTANNLKEQFDFSFVLPKNTKGRILVEGQGFDSIYEFNLKEIGKNILGLIIYLPVLLWNAVQLKRLIKRKKIDAVHVNDIYNLLPVAVRLLGCRIPYVCHIRFLPNKFPSLLFRIWLRAHLRYAERIIIVSESVMNMLKPHPKFKLIYDGLPAGERYPNEVKRGNEQPVFLYLSNFIQGKGQDFALEAFYEVNKEYPHWKMRFVGSDMGLEKNKYYREKLYKRANQLNISEKIEWQGFTNDVEKEYKFADIVLNFSESESFSITCVEALYFGRPLISTACGGPAEIIEHEHTGLIIPNRDVKAMADAMKWMVLNQIERAQLAERARKRIREKFSLESTAYQLKDIYTRLLSKR